MPQYQYLALFDFTRDKRQKMLAAVNCRSSSSSSSCPSPPRSQSVADNGFLRNVLNMSPRLSSYFNPIVQLDRTLSEQASICWDSEKKKAVACSCISCVSSTDHTHTPKRQCCAELKEEIATLELEIMQLERHLLSLYRTAFQGQLSTLPNTPNSTSISLVSAHHHHHYQAQREQKVGGSRHRSLAEHLGASPGINNPDRLSEDIVRCISSIYCKIANPNDQVSPSSSLSSSTLFSSTIHCESWSPRGRHPSYAAMVQLLNIHLDHNTFDYAATMLHNFRSLVKNLEKVDPRKMKREEKLAFWINIHNALVMHAYLAYGSGNRVKTASVLKAAYNVGGHCVNAYVIQSSILGIRSHHSGPTLLFRGRKMKAHEYALEYPEPLVHFALCSGAYSDPAVRAYGAKTIFEDLKVAKKEFIEANVEIQKHKDKDTKLLVPRLIDYFAKDMSLSMQQLLNLILESLSDLDLQNTSCMQGRKPDKYLQWIPHSHTFRYVIHSDLAHATATATANAAHPHHHH